MSQDNAPNTPDTFEEAERFQRLFVTPVVTQMKTEITALIQPVVDSHKSMQGKLIEQDKRITDLENGQRKALVGYGVFAAGLSVVVGASWDWLKGKVGWK